MNGDCVKYSYSVPLASEAPAGNAEEPNSEGISPEVAQEIHESGFYT